MATDQAQRDDVMTDCIHRLGDGCGELAFRIVGYPARGVVRRSDFILPDGSHPVAGTQIVCGSCGRPTPNWPPRPTPDGPREVSV